MGLNHVKQLVHVYNGLVHDVADVIYSLLTQGKKRECDFNPYMLLVLLVRLSS